MEDQNMNPTSDEATQSPAGEPKKAPAYGTILGIVLIVVILVVGAFYVWGERLEQEQPLPENGVRGEVLPDVEGTAGLEVGENEPQPQ